MGPFYDVLEEHGITISDEGEFGVVLADEYLRSDLNDYNNQSIKQKKPWMIIKPVGLEIFIGPIFIPQKTGCWKCLSDRYILNRAVERFVMEKQGYKEYFKPSKAYTPATMRIAYSMAAQEISNWLVNEDNHSLSGKMISVDTRTWKSTAHVLTQQHRCPACGEEFTKKDNRELESLKLQSRKASFTKDGGHRTCSPQETIEKYSHLISPVTGIVNLLERDTRLDSSVHI
jgi:ribosomal protein S12 methylthiotransferase accessory factor